MEDNSTPTPGNLRNTAKPGAPARPGHGRGFNDPNFADQDEVDKNKPKDKTSRELPPDPNFTKFEEDIKEEEDTVDPGNEHRH